MSFFLHSVILNETDEKIKVIITLILRSIIMKFKKIKINSKYIFLILFVGVLLDIYYETNSLHNEEIQRVDKNLYKTADNPHRRQHRGAP